MRGEAHLKVANVVTEGNESKWVQVRRKIYPDGRRYDFAHHPWCFGLGVAVVPYRTKLIPDFAGTGSPASGMEYLARFEIHAAHDDNKYEMGAITGGYDKPTETFAQCAAREIYEEAGYAVHADQLRYLGHAHPSKASDTVMHLYAVDLTDYTGEVVEPIGDGTAYEVGGYSKWVSLDDALRSVDPLFVTAIARANFTNTYAGGSH